MFDFHVDATQTVGEFLAGFFVGKKKIHELYMEGKLILNGKPVSSRQMMHGGDVLSLPIFEAEDIDFVPEYGELDIVFEDEHLLIINKPPGILVHPDEKSKTGTLCNLVAGYYKKTGQRRRVRYIHRLDIETSGGIIFAKHFLAHSRLDAQLEKKEIKRTYLAFAQGKLANKSGTIDAPIGKDRHHGARRRVAKTGDFAQTRYRLLHFVHGISIVELSLQTGRTHQIRVHLSHIGHPLLGDRLYGGPASMKRHALHSWKITLDHPILPKGVSVEIPVPADMERLLAKSKKKDR